MQRIFKYGDIQNTSLTVLLIKSLKNSVYKTPSFIIIYKSYTLLNMAHAVYIHMTVHEGVLLSGPHTQCMFSM